MEYNPWNVSSLEAFHFYNCPECEYKYPTKEHFVDHALVSHPKSRRIIPMIYKSDVQTMPQSVPNSAQNSQSFIKIEEPEPNTSQVVNLRLPNFESSVNFTQVEGTHSALLVEGGFRVRLSC